MKSVRLLLASLSVVALSAGFGMAQSFPSPGPEHAWLQQFVGDWTTESEALMDPGQPPVKATGTETVRALGGFWTTSEVRSNMQGKPFTGNLTLGYDQDKKKYVGTWVDSMTGHMWQYEGTVDASGKVLTLESEGACPVHPEKLSKFKEVIQIDDQDNKTFTSSVLGDNGQWMTVMTSHAHRIK